VDNLEAMDEAVNYRRHLVREVAAVAGQPRAEMGLLDFGAGIGTYAIDLRDAGYSVSCIEIDAGLRERLTARGFDAHGHPREVADPVPVAYTFNVLEHIEDDRAALRELRQAIQPGGSLIVYVPAFPMLYTSMDRKVGHFRRYRRRDLIDTVVDAGFDVESCRYADSLGFAATLAYRLIGSKEGDITGRSVRIYDRYVFPISSALDPVTRRLFGKNLLLVARRPLNGSGQRF
jgi:SAM-dependent methyltransferase